MAALAGESQNFDGNGQMVRFQTGGGTQTLSTGRSNATNQPGFFNLASPPIGNRPVYDGKRPPYRPDAPCFKQALPDLNAANTGPPDGQGTPTGTPPDNNPGTGPSTPLPPLNNLPPLPAPAQGVVNTITGAIPTARSSSSTASRKRSSLAGELVSRLNPYRTAGRKTTTSRRSARARKGRVTR
jgi:hypothetical protein